MLEVPFFLASLWRGCHYIVKDIQGHIVQSAIQYFKTTSLLLKLVWVTKSEDAATQKYFKTKVDKYTDGIQKTVWYSDNKDLLIIQMS